MTKEAVVLAQCKYLLRILRNRGLLAFKRIHVSGIPRGDRRSGSVSYSKNRDMAGMTDLLIFLPGGRTLHAEVKSTRGVLSDDQIAWRDELTQMGHDWCMVRSPDELISILKAQGVPVPIRSARDTK